MIDGDLAFEMGDWKKKQSDSIMEFHSSKWLGKDLSKVQSIGQSIGRVWGRV